MLHRIAWIFFRYSTSSPLHRVTLATRYDTNAKHCRCYKWTCRVATPGSRLVYCFYANVWRSQVFYLHSLTSPPVWQLTFSFPLKLNFPILTSDVRRLPTSKKNYGAYLRFHPQAVTLNYFCRDNPMQRNFLSKYCVLISPSWHHHHAYTSACVVAIGLSGLQSNHNYSAIGPWCCRCIAEYRLSQRHT